MTCRHDHSRFCRAIRRPPAPHFPPWRTSGKFRPSSRRSLLAQRWPYCVQRRRNFSSRTRADNFMGASPQVGPGKSAGLTQGVFTVVPLSPPLKSKGSFSRWRTQQLIRGCARCRNLFHQSKARLIARPFRPSATSKWPSFLLRQPKFDNQPG